MTARLHPPSDAKSSITVFGRAYNPLAGVQDVPDSDAAILISNGWVNAAAGAVLSQSGATTARPLSPKKGTAFVDSTLGVNIIFDGKVWRNAATGVAV